MPLAMTERLDLAAQAARSIEEIRSILDEAEIYTEETRDTVERALGAAESELLRWRLELGLKTGYLKLPHRR